MSGDGDADADAVVVADADVVAAAVPDAVVAGRVVVAADDAHPAFHQDDPQTHTTAIRSGYRS